MKTFPLPKQVPNSNSHIFLTHSDSKSLSKEARDALVQDLLDGIDVMSEFPTSPIQSPTQSTPIPVLKANERVKKFAYPKSPGSPSTPAQNVTRNPIGIRPPTSDPGPRAGGGRGAFGRGSRPFSTPRNLHPNLRPTTPTDTPITSNFSL
jgi:hypothetical protein